MSQAVHYAPRCAWGDAVRDLRSGALLLARAVVTVAGSVALLAGAWILADRDARQAVVELAAAIWPQPEPVVEQVASAAEIGADSPAVPAASIDPRQKHVVQYLVRRYRVADDAVNQLVAAAFDIGREKKLDPLLILSVMAIESNFNPFAQSPVGAQGLMQVMTRVHAERFEPHGGEHAALDPIANIKVGSAILHELISRGGSVERGLQLYVGAGNLPDDGGYGARVLGERSRLELAATGKVAAAYVSAVRAAAPAVQKPADGGEPSTPIVHTGGVSPEAEAVPKTAERAV